MASRIIRHLKHDIAKLYSLGDAPVQKRQTCVLVEGRRVNNNVFDADVKVGGAILMRILSKDDEAAAEAGTDFDSRRIDRITHQDCSHKKLNRLREEICAGWQVHNCRLARGAQGVAGPVCEAVASIDSILDGSRVICRPVAFGTIGGFDVTKDRPGSS